MSELDCPGCGHLDGVPKRVIERSSLRRRWWLVGPMVAVAHVVGRVYLCPHCGTEFCTGPSGSYRPNGGPIKRQREPEANGPPQRETARSLRDSDQAWD